MTTAGFDIKKLIPIRFFSFFQAIVLPASTYFNDVLVRRRPILRILIKKYYFSLKKKDKRKKVDIVKIF